MNNKNMNLQDVFLNQARKDHIGVTIFLTNGFQFKGLTAILSFWNVTENKTWYTNTPFPPSFPYVLFPF